MDKISKSNQLVTVSSKESHNDISSDAVIITVPVPQLLNLQGTFKDCLKPHEQLLSQVQYSSRYALALYITNKLGIDVPWSCKYVDNDECIRFVSVDTAKRGCGKCINYLRWQIIIDLYCTEGAGTLIQGISAEAINLDSRSYEILQRRR